ncbi:hypothetical protein Q1695_015442 [Nippostrongylus brasiliensis]|nr:hypothetical protein Q1695_015442 [Nippostrongylus brasiliensis]
MYLLPALLACLVLAIRKMSATNGTFPTVEFGCYNSSDHPLEINCADDDVTRMKGFSTMQKIWKKDQKEQFNAENIIFVENNISLRFAALQPKHSGVYTCCTRQSDNGKFHCIDRKLKVLNVNDNSSQPLDSSDVSGNGPTPITAWNVSLIYDDVMFGKNGNWYFLKLFKENATDIRCLQDGQEAPIETNKSFGPNINSDGLIRSFNASVHTGWYECNSTVTIGNETEINTVNFTIYESTVPNRNEERINSTIVEMLAKNPAPNVHILSVLLIVVPLLLVFFL